MKKRADANRDDADKSNVKANRPCIIPAKGVPGKGGKTFFYGEVSGFRELRYFQCIEVPPEKGVLEISLLSH